MDDISKKNILKACFPDCNYFEEFAAERATDIKYIYKGMSLYHKNKSSEYIQRIVSVVTKLHRNNISYEECISELMKIKNV